MCPSFCPNLHLAIRKGLSWFFSWPDILIFFNEKNHGYCFLNILFIRDYSQNHTHEFVYLHILYYSKRHALLGLSTNTAIQSNMYCYYLYYLYLDHDDVDHMRKSNALTFSNKRRLWLKKEAIIRNFPTQNRWWSRTNESRHQLKTGCVFSESVFCLVCHHVNTFTLYQWSHSNVLLCFTFL